MISLKIDKHYLPFLVGASAAALCAGLSNSEALAESVLPPVDAVDVLSNEVEKTVVSEPILEPVTVDQDVSGEDLVLPEEEVVSEREEIQEVDVPLTANYSHKNAESTQSMPRQYIFVVDRSASVSGEQAKYANQLLEGIIDQMGEDDEASIVYTIWNDPVHFVEFLGYKYVGGELIKDDGSDPKRSIFSMGLGFTSSKQALKSNLKEHDIYPQDTDKKFTDLSKLDPNKAKSIVWVGDKGLLYDWIPYWMDNKPTKTVLTELKRALDFKAVIPVVMGSAVKGEDPNLGIGTPDGLHSFNLLESDLINVKDFLNNPSEKDVDHVVKKTLETTLIRVPTTYRFVYDDPDLKVLSGTIERQGSSDVYDIPIQDGGFDFKYTFDEDGEYTLKLQTQGKLDGKSVKEVEVKVYQGSKQLNLDQFTWRIEEGGSTRYQTIRRRIPFEVEEKQDPTLKAGEERIERYGKDGYIEEEVKIEANGERTVLNELNRVDSVSKIIVKGSMTEETKEIIETESIAFEVEYIEDKSIPEGEEKVDVEGVEGELTKTYKLTIVNGEEVNRELVKEEVTKAPVNKVIRVGKMVTEVKEITEKEAIPFEKQTEKSATLKLGETRVRQEGKDGALTKTYKVTIVNGEEVKRELVNEEVTQKAVPEITEVGLLEIKEVTETEVIPFEKLEKEDHTLPKGETKVVSGKEGELTRRYEVHIVEGKEVKRVLLEEKVTVEKEDEITYVGTKEEPVPAPTPTPATPQLPETGEADASAWVAGALGAGLIGLGVLSLKRRKEDENVDSNMFE